jgi:hypothetical protein
MLDSGTTLTILYAPLARQIITDIGGTLQSNGVYIAPCTLRSTSGTVNFNIGGQVIKVPFSDFLRDISDPQGRCIVMMDTTTSQQILGDSVLRAGYFVFDWDNAAVHIAQAANCGTEIVAIGSGVGAVPAVSGNCGGASIPSVTTSATPTRSTTRSATPTVSLSRSSLPPSASTSVGSGSTGVPTTSVTTTSLSSTTPATTSASATTPRTVAGAASSTGSRSYIWLGSFAVAMWILM